MTHWQLGTFVQANISLALQYLGIPKTILSESLYATFSLLIVLDRQV